MNAYMRIGTILANGALLLAAIGIPNAVAQPYPGRPIKMIVPFPPGGVTDVVSRIMAQKLSEGLGQQVVVENRAGAAGTVGADAAAKSPADGYTLFFGTTGTLASAPSLQPNLPYDPSKSFAPISQLTDSPFVVIVNATVPVKSLKELIDLARSKPGKLTYGTPGTGHVLHITGEMFKIATGVDLFHVPYKGAGPAMTDLVAGRIDIVFDTIAIHLPHIRSGRLRALAVASSRRIAQVPEVPTAAEAGLAGFELGAWFGLLAPRGTPNEIVRRLNAEVLKALAIPEVVEVFTKQGLQPAGSSPEQFATLIVEDIAKWTRAVRAAGIKIE